MDPQDPTQCWGLLLARAFPCTSHGLTRQRHQDRHGRDVDLLEPSHVHAIDHRRGAAQNISETLTYLDVAGGTGLQTRWPKAGEQQPDGGWRFKAASGRHPLLGWHDL